MSAFTSARPQLSDRQKRDRKVAYRKSTRQSLQERPGKTFVHTPHVELGPVESNDNDGGFKPVVAFESWV